jgi:hypothetical protein
MAAYVDILNILMDVGVKILKMTLIHSQAELNA